jgi:hypothetical protein
MTRTQMMVAVFGKKERKRENQKEVKEVRGLGFNNHNGRLI